MTAETDFDGMHSFCINYTLLFPVITELRVYKTKKEIEVLRYVNKVSSDAHKMVMKRVRPGLMEYQCESIFLDYCYFTGGSRHVAYTCICASGHNSGVLHYGHAGAPNDKKIQDGDICCFDMGCSYFGYASDITCTFPANGKFTEDQKFIYNTVLCGRAKVYEIAKPGVSWVDCHRAACEEMLLCLKKGGLLQGDVADMMDANLGAIFQPHGLGHLIGCDVHDVGGYTSKTPERPTAPGFNRLRTARILEVGMALTVEPGCYFIPTLLDRAMENPTQKKFLVPEELNRFRNFGGVRIEDDVIVTEDGLENLTKVPRTVEEIESWMAKSDYTQAIDNLIYSGSG
ncbi:UNVERIFIED_CONTAM: hypothetical protein PYX00_000741 [Menopon gallinae]|uniref:Peptidase M24 domain-containing protein n=1 Tax=Menopon gallinae TaxID=328185 RepID=A0AAW2IAD3_9NEOP